MENTVYVLTIECATEDIAKAIQSSVNHEYHSGEVFWNAYHKK